MANQFDLKKFLNENKLTKASKVLTEGDSFDYSNLILSTINSLTDMGEEGQNALRVLEKISDWNEVVRLATEE
jgi:hypothetical protein